MISTKPASNTTDSPRAKAADASLNDVFLAICGGALRRYLIEHDQLPPESLTANVPVSVRAHEGARVGNAVTFLYAQLGTDVEDPVERVGAISASTRLGKERLPEVGRRPWTPTPPC